ncbi:MAG: HprK-related kinase A [Pseudomonadales bacterium]
MQQRLADLSADDHHRRLRRDGLHFRAGPFTLLVNSPIPQIEALIALFYAEYPLASGNDYRDFHLRVTHTSTLRRWIRPSAGFKGDGESPFTPMPARSSFPLFEWGLNWRVATTAHQYLMLHAAVVERDGVTVAMPALPGSGKSTLAAALMCRGWRLLSDEFGLVRPGTTAFVPFPRPIPLKNESIPLIARFHPEAVIGPTFEGTRKGDVAHLKASAASIARADEPAAITHVIFPRYQMGAEATFHAIEKARAFMKVSSNSFNYQILGRDGFRTVAGLIENSSCQSFIYSNLDDAIAAFDGLSSSGTSAYGAAPISAAASNS